MVITRQYKGRGLGTSGRGGKHRWGWVGDQEGCSEGMKFKPSLGGWKRAGHVRAEGSVCQAEGTACAKVLRQVQTGLLEEVNVCTGLRLTLMLLLPKTELSGTGWEL